MICPLETHSMLWITEDVILRDILSDIADNDITKTNVRRNFTIALFFLHDSYFI